VVSGIVYLAAVLFALYLRATFWQQRHGDAQRAAHRALPQACLSGENGVNGVARAFGIVWCSCRLRCWRAPAAGRGERAERVLPFAGVPSLLFALPPLSTATPPLAALLPLFCCYRCLAT